MPGIIDAGKVRFFTVDSIDYQSWVNWGAHPADRARRHEDYDRYIVQEVVPFIRGYGHEKALTTGCSMGAYHSANFFFRHPDCFDGCIALSGLFRLNHFIGDYMDDTVYFNTPLAYLPNMNDPWFLDQYRQSQIVICVGQGAWEDGMRVDTAELRRILADKGRSGLDRLLGPRCGPRLALVARADAVFPPPTGVVTPRRWAQRIARARIPGRKVNCS